MNILSSFMACRLLSLGYSNSGSLPDFFYDYRSQHIMSIAMFWIVVIVLIILMIIVISKKNKIIGIKIDELMEMKKTVDSKSKEAAELLSKKIERDKIVNEAIREMDGLDFNNEASKEKVSRIIKSLRSTITDDAITDFDKYFLSIYPDFYNNLSTAYPKLTRNELRLCAMIRQNMSTKDIAEMNKIEPNSARIAKNRLRKNLGISNTEESLFTFLLKF